MRRAGNLAGALLALVIALGIPYALYLLVNSAANTLATLDADSSSAVVTAAVAGFVSVVTLVLGKRYEASQAMVVEIRAKKIPVYEDLLRFMFQVFNRDKLGTSQSDLDAQFTAVAQRFIVWASSDVLKAWSDFRRLAHSDRDKSLLALEAVLLAIRKDLGHRDGKLEPGDILAAWILNPQARSEQDNQATPP